MESWDQETLERIVEERRTERDRRKTTIVCKYFLEALEQRKYGFFWICPNGGDDCTYVHALPPGYVLQKKEPKGVPKDDEEDDGPTLEEQIEAERMKVRGGEPVTKESFERWKKAKMEKRAADAKKQEEEKRAAVQSGRNVLLSGRELLIYKPQLFADDEQAMVVDELQAMAPEEFDAQLAARDAEAQAEMDAAMKAEIDAEAAEEKLAVTAAAAVGDASLFVDDDDDDDEEDEEGEEEEEEHDDEEEDEEDEERKDTLAPPASSDS
jgi:hypothetical protein